MLKETFIAMRDLPRVKEISSVLITFGLQEFAQRLKLPYAVKKASNWLHLSDDKNVEDLSTATRVRLAMEELGPTFIKLGQVLSTRVDIFSEEWICEFEQLQSNVPEISPDKLPELLEKALGGKIDSFFYSFDYKPIGAGSIAQVHQAYLPDGTKVAVKLRRPGIKNKIEADLRVMKYLAMLLEREVSDSRRYQPTELVKYFSKSLHRELDLSLEARNMESFRQDFSDDPHIQIPKVYWPLTNTYVNVQEFVEGISAADLARLEDEQFDLSVLAKIGAHAVLKMILVNGFFHADPHPGNVFFIDQEHIAFIDFGMVGRLSQRRRDEIIRLLAALGEKNELGIFDVLMQWTNDDVINESQFLCDISDMLFNYDLVPLKDLNISNLINDTMSLIREHSIVLPSEMAMLIKALLSLEGLGRQLDPQFQLIPFMAPFVHKVMLKKYSPAYVLKQGKNTLVEVSDMLLNLPRDLVRLGRDMRQGRFRVNLDLERLDHFASQLDKMINRLTLGIVTGCLIIGSAIVMTVDAGPKLWDMPIFGFIGFSFALVNSIIIIWSIFRSSRKEG